jgi:mannose-6-phosphate isomerase-like protein (cupin superfamily)
MITVVTVNEGRRTVTHDKHVTIVEVLVIFQGNVQVVINFLVEDRNPGEEAEAFMVE